MLECDAAKVKPGLKGNLIVKVFVQRTGTGEKDMTVSSASLSTWTITFSLARIPFAANCTESATSKFPCII